MLIPLFAATCYQAAVRVRTELILSIKPNHLFPLTTFSRAANIRSVQTNGSSQAHLAGNLDLFPCLAICTDGTAFCSCSSYQPSCLTSLYAVLLAALLVRHGSCPGITCSFAPIPAQVFHRVGPGEVSFPQDGVSKAFHYPELRYYEGSDSCIPHLSIQVSLLISLCLPDVRPNHPAGLSNDLNRYHSVISASRTSS